MTPTPPLQESGRCARGSTPPQASCLLPCSRIPPFTMASVASEVLEVCVTKLRVNWAEITLCQHPLGPSQCFVLIKQSDSPCPYQF